MVIRQTSQSGIFKTTADKHLRYYRCHASPVRFQLPDRPAEWCLSSLKIQVKPFLLLQNQEFQAWEQSHSRRCLSEVRARGGAGQRSWEDQWHIPLLAGCVAWDGSLSFSGHRFYLWNMRFGLGDHTSLFLFYNCEWLPQENSLRFRTCKAKTKEG